LKRSYFHSYFSQNSLNYASLINFFGARGVLASVTPDRVRNRVNLSSSDIGDSIVTEFIVDACAEIMLETGRTIDYQNCDQVEASCITDLAALYCLTYLTGGCERARGHIFFLSAHIVALILNLVAICFRS